MRASRAEYEVGDEIPTQEGHTYKVLGQLGRGAFGQVFKCQPSFRDEPVALKVIKTKKDCFRQALREAELLQELNSKHDPTGEQNVVRMLDYFVCGRHLCISFELLGVSLLEVLKQNEFHGLSMDLIRAVTEELLKALSCLRKANVIHCDLKPENVMLIDKHHTKIKLIDFGIACTEKRIVRSYVQTRWCRSPEVLVGVPYTSAIDMWSLGCVCAELFLGVPFLPGHSEYDQVSRVVEVLGLPPTSMLEAGKKTSRYFCEVEVAPVDSAGGVDGALCNDGEGAGGDVEFAGQAPMRVVETRAAAAPAHLSGCTDGSAGSRDTRRTWRLKTREEYERETGRKEKVSKQHFNLLSMEKLAELVPSGASLDAHLRKQTTERRQRSLRFLRGLLQLSPEQRWTPEQAAQHPFICQAAFDADVGPSPDKPQPTS